MSNTGSTRGHCASHRGRDYRRPYNNQAFPDTNALVFESRRTLSVGSGRRRRGFQPDEVNKNKERLGPGDPPASQGGGNAENLTAIDNQLESSATTKKLASTMVPNKMEALAPHRRTQIKDKNPTHHPSMDASCPELDPVHVGIVSQPIESETSSIQFIIERKPSCWTIANPPGTPPTGWNSTAANIDNSATVRMPIYRFPKLEHKVKSETASSSFDRQQAKLKSHANVSMPKAQEFCETNDLPFLASPEKDEGQTAVRVAHQKDGYAADALQHQRQQLQHNRPVDSEKSLQVNLNQLKVFAKAIQAPSGLQRRSDLSIASSPTRGTLQAKNLSVGKNNIASSAVISQAELDRQSTPPQKQSGATPPHLRVPCTRPRADQKIKPLPPHLRGSAISSFTAQTEANTSHRPTIDMDEEIAATQPILDIDEEIVAGLRAQTLDEFPVAQPTDNNAQETHEQVIYEPPNTRAQFLRSKASAAGPKSGITDEDMNSRAGQLEDRNHSANMRSNGLTIRPAIQDFTRKQENAGLASPLKEGPVLDRSKPSVKKDKNPVREFESVHYTSELVGWDGKMNPPPVGDEWDHRRPFNPQIQERISVIEAWRKEHAPDPENNHVMINTASAEFQTGEGLAGGDVNVLSPIDKREHETRTPNDDFTQARRHQNAAEAMKNYKAKIAAKPKTVPSGIEGMTKEERRSLRRALIEEERTRVIPPNPHAPAANVYLRPAEFKDMGQVMNIYNYYVCDATSFVLDLEPVDELYWRSRLQEAKDERNPFVVAIHMGEKSRRHQGDIIRKKQENVVGFAVAANFGSKHTIYHNSVELEPMVHPKFFHQGIGRTMLDRMLAALSPDHNLLECAPFIPQNDIAHWIGGGSRQAKAIIVNVLYADGEEDTVTWRKHWYTKYGFQHVGTLPHVGFSKGKLLDMCQLVLNTSARL